MVSIRALSQRRARRSAGNPGSEMHRDGWVVTAVAAVGLKRGVYMAGFCRDCLSDVPDQAARCADCGSPRLFRHRALDQLAIPHIDCDALYATIEKRDDPALRDK